MCGFTLRWMECCGRRRGSGSGGSNGGGVNGGCEMVLLDEVLFEREAGVVLLLVIMSYDDYEVIVIR